MSGSNRGFWKVIVPLGVGGIVLVVLVLVFRPVARTGAVAYAQTNLRRTAEAVELVAAAGSLADADRIRLATEGGVDDLLLIDPDQSSNDPEVVSVLATEAAWTGSAGQTGECFWIRVAARDGRVARDRLRHRDRLLRRRGGAPPSRGRGPSRSAVAQRDRTRATEPPGSTIEASTRWKGGPVANVSVIVNGVAREADVEPRTLLVYFLRETLGLTGTNVGCDTSSCGSCTVLLDGESVKSCTVLAVQAEGREITTIEGRPSNGQMHPIQEAFHRNHGLQCGYCTPGMIMAAASYLKETPNPTEEQVRLSLEGNLCRCTGYDSIVEVDPRRRRPDDRREGLRGRHGDHGEVRRSAGAPQGGRPLLTGAGAASSTTCPCRACCTWPSSEARSRTRAS